MGLLPLPCREGAYLGEGAPPDGWEDLVLLKSHWAVLPDERKQSFAQMAALTRYASSLFTSRRFVLFICYSLFM